MAAANFAKGVKCDDEGNAKLLFNLASYPGGHPKVSVELDHKVVQGKAFGAQSVHDL